MNSYFKRLISGARPSLGTRCRWQRARALLCRRARDRHRAVPPPGLPPLLLRYETNKTFIIFWKNSFILGAPVPQVTISSVLPITVKQSPQLKCCRYMVTLKLTLILGAPVPTINPAQLPSTTGAPTGIIMVFMLYNNMKLKIFKPQTERQRRPQKTERHPPTKTLLPPPPNVSHKFLN